MIQIPDTRREKIAKSTKDGKWYKYADKDGYTVHYLDLDKTNFLTVI